MGLSETEREHLRCILQQYEEDPRVLEMDNYIQHGCVTTYQHCWNVARVSFWINRRFHVGADERALAVGALLHDFYLYDWHCEGRFQHCSGLRTLFKMHGFIHPLLHHPQPYVAADPLPRALLPRGGDRLHRRQVLRRP